MTDSHTKIPNIIFDIHLPVLKESELKVLLIVFRQTVGWIDKKTGSRKTHDRISRSQFVRKTGLSCKIISKAIQSLLTKGLISITDQSRNLLISSSDRKGKKKIYYSFNTGNIFPSTKENSVLSLGNNYTYNKRNYTKENKTKESGQRFEDIEDLNIGDTITQARSYLIDPCGCFSS